MSGAQKWMDKLKAAEKTCLVSDGKNKKIQFNRLGIFSQNQDDSGYFFVFFLKYFKIKIIKKQVEERSIILFLTKPKWRKNILCKMENF